MPPADKRKAYKRLARVPIEQKAAHRRRTKATRVVDRRVMVRAGTGTRSKSAAVAAEDVNSITS